MARTRICMKVKELSCVFNTDLDDYKGVAQAVLTLKTLYDWFDWSCIDDLIVQSGDPSSPCGFSVSSIICHMEDEND